MSIARPLRVAYLEATGMIGGAEQMLLSILARLPRNEVDGCFFCAESGPLVAQVGTIGLQTTVVPAGPFASISLVTKGHKVFNPAAVCFNLCQFARAARLHQEPLRHYKPDLIHTNTMAAHFYGGLVGRWLSVPVVWHMHDTIEERRLFGLFRQLFRGLTALLPDRVVVVSRGDLALVARTRGVVIYNAVDLEKVPDAAHPLKTDLESLLATIEQYAVVGIVARLGYDKGIDVAIKAAARVCQTSPGTRFIFAGDAIFGETNYKHNLMELVVQLDLQNHVTFVGHREDVLALMERCDLIVLPSRRESFGLTLIEAGALAKPVVATKVGGVPEVVVDGETGLLVPSEDAEALAGAILRLLRAPELAWRLGCNARRRVEQHFTIQRAADNLLALYHELVQT